MPGHLHHRRELRGRLPHFAAAGRRFPERDLARASLAAVRPTTPKRRQVAAKIREMGTRRRSGRSGSTLYLVFSGMVRLRRKIEGRTFRQTGHEIEFAKLQTASALAAPDTGQGRAEDRRTSEGDTSGRKEGRGGRRSAPEAGSRRRTVGSGERFRLPEIPRQIASGILAQPQPPWPACST